VSHSAAFPLSRGIDPLYLASQRISAAGRDARQNTEQSTTMHPRISLITLGARDLGRSLVFYRDGLGFATTWDIDKGVILFQTGGTCLALYPLEKLAEDVGSEFDVPTAKFAGITLAHNVRNKQDVDRLIAEAEQRAQRSRSRQPTRSAAIIAAISPTPTATSGRSPGERSSSAMTTV
jgi:catechol 2,3-dioxygenase-like lactoylglutathione lyase family enzyme